MVSVSGKLGWFNWVMLRDVGVNFNAKLKGYELMQIKSSVHIIPVVSLHTAL